MSSTDPAAANGYTYSGNNPITYNDASGLMYKDHGPGNTVTTEEPEPEPEPTFEEGVKDGAGEEVMEVLDSLNPVTIAKNLFKMITDPPNMKKFFMDVVKGLLPIDKFKAAYDAYQSGDDYAFGKSIGKLAVSVSGEIAGMIFGGGAKLVSMLGKAAKAGRGSSGNTPELSNSGDGDSCENSFSGGTRVLMADGTAKPIAEVRAGDVVWATDPVSGIAGRRVVTHTWPHRDMLVRLEIDGQVLVTTEDHPFWSVTDQAWERADQLGAGEKVLAADGAAHLVTAPIDLATAFYDGAYNLTVDGIHTYHVLTDPDRGPPVDVLVHNCDPLRTYADSIRNEPGAKFASEYTSPSGRKYYGRNRHGEEADGELADVLEATGHHGGCAEVHCLIRAQREEGPSAIRGGIMRTIRTRNDVNPSSNPEGHGEPAHPCGRCSRLQAELDIE